MRRIPRFAVVLLGLVAPATPIAAQPPIAWRSVGVGGGGALFAPSWSLHNPSELYLACDLSAQFRTVDTGLSWTLTPYTILQVGRDSPQMQFTPNPSILYMIDFTGELRTPVRSTNGGQSWSMLSGDPTGREAYRIIADWSDPAKVLLTDYFTLYSSTNSGASFTQRFQTASGNGLHVGGAFFDNAFIAIGTNQGVLVSTDGGGSFAVAALTGIPADEAIVSFAGGKSNGITRFYAVTLPADSVYAGIQGDDAGLYRSVYSLDWPATNWVQKVTGISAADDAFFVDCARNDSSTAYLAGTRGENPVIYKTTNGGNTWTSMLNVTNNANVATGWCGTGGDRGWGYAELCFGFDVHPTDGNRLVFTDYGFAHISTDGAANWRQAYVDPATQNPPGAPTPQRRDYRGIGLENTTSWSLTWITPSSIWASFSDIRGIRSADGGDTWGFDYAGHTRNSSYRVARQPANGRLYMATSTIHDIYQSTYLTDARLNTGSGAVMQSLDNGINWTAMGTLTLPIVWVANDPNNVNRLYASAIHSVNGGIFRSDNALNGASATWTRMTPPPRTEGHPFNIVVLTDGTLVVTYSARRAGSPLNFTASSGIFVSTDAGQSWIDRSHPNMQYWTKDVTIDPHDADQNTWFVSVWSGYGGASNGLGGLYRTTNRGQSWTRLNSRDRVSSCTLNPIRPGELYMTTEQEGLWHCPNANAGAPTFSPVASYPYRQPERVLFNPHNAGDIWVTNFGQGLRVGRVPRGDLNCDGMVTAADVPAFVLALLDPSAYAATFPNCDITQADADFSGANDGADVQPFAALLP